MRRQNAAVTTRRPLTLEELVAVLAPLGTPVRTEPLDGGLFAAVHRVELGDGRGVVVKTGTPVGDDRPPLLSYEQDLLRAEIALLREAEALDEVPTPTVLLTDTTRTHVEVDVLVTELLPGRTWEAVRRTMSDAARRSAGRGTGAALAGLHRLTRSHFGYPSSPTLQGADWPSTFVQIVDALLADADLWDVEVDATRVRRAVRRQVADLAMVDRPALVHMDLWPGNVLVEPATGAVVGVVDLERGLWGDPLADLAGAAPMSLAAPSPALVAGYQAAGGTLPVDPAAGTASGLTVSADRRLDLYRLYLAVLMTVEVVPRGYGGEGFGRYVDDLVGLRRALLDRLG